MKALLISNLLYIINTRLVHENEVHENEEWE